MRAYNSFNDLISVIFNNLQTRTEKYNFTKFHNLTKNDYILTIIILQTKISKVNFGSLIENVNTFKNFMIWWENYVDSGQ
jgi:hypothetical protein